MSEQLPDHIDGCGCRRHPDFDVLFPCSLHAEPSETPESTPVDANAEMLEEALRMNF